MTPFEGSRRALRALEIAIAATVALVGIEFVVGVIAHSLALIGDGWHNLADVPALAFSWTALAWQHKPPDRRKTFGYGRAGVLAAFVNALILLPVAVMICYGGYERIVHPPAVNSWLMTGVGVLALVINAGISLALGRERGDLNLRAVFVHFLGDALSNLGIIAGGILILLTHQPRIDPIIAFLIAGMIAWNAVGILAESGNILLEGMPKGVKLEAIARAILAVPGVREVHDIHVWSLASQSHALSCHVHILDMSTSASEQIAHQIRETLADHFGINHSTIQFEHTHAPGDFHHYMPETAPAGEKK